MTEGVFILMANENKHVLVAYAGTGEIDLIS